MLRRGCDGSTRGRERDPRPRTPPWRTLALLALCTGALAGARAGAVWREEAGEDGNRVYSREVEGSRLREYKVDLTVDAPVEQVWAVLTDWDGPPVMPRVLERRVLERSPSEVILYQKDDCSPIKPRDYAVRVRTGGDGTTYTLTSELANDHAPEPQDGVVRVTAQRRTWTLRPDGERTRLEIVIYYDPGGRIPDRLYSLGMPENLLNIRDAIQAAVASR